MRVERSTKDSRYHPYQAGSQGGIRAGNSSNGSNGDGNTRAATVASHYNSRADGGREARAQSKILHLRKFNNWVKSILIGSWAPRGGVVLDLGAGKGGDLLKWRTAGVGHIVHADIAEGSVRDAMGRVASMRPPLQSSMTFIAGDCTSDVLSSVLPPNILLDLTSAQFCFHYAFESRARAKGMMMNASDRLAPGAACVMTIPSAPFIVTQLRKSIAAMPWFSKPEEGDGDKEEAVSFGNAIYSVRFNATRAAFRSESGSSNPPAVWSKAFGAEYFFTLVDSVTDCPEYLIHPNVLKGLAEEYHMEVVETIPFHAMHQRYANHPSWGPMLSRMSVMEDPRKGTRLSQDEWEAAGFYNAVILRKKVDAPRPSMPEGAGRWLPVPPPRAGYNPDRDLKILPGAGRI